MYLAWLPARFHSFSEPLLSLLSLAYSETSFPQPVWHNNTSHILLTVKERNRYMVCVRRACQVILLSLRLLSLAFYFLDLHLDAFPR